MDSVCKEVCTFHQHKDLNVHLYNAFLLDFLEDAADTVDACVQYYQYLCRLRKTNHFFTGLIASFRVFLLVTVYSTNAIIVHWIA